MFTTAQSGIWVGLLVTLLRGPSKNTQRDFCLIFEGCQNIFGLFVIRILSKLEKVFSEVTVSWEEVRTAATNQEEWKSSVKALYATRHEEDR